MCGVIGIFGFKGPVAPMRDGDAVICFNYRADRMRQIVRALIDPGFDGFDVSREEAEALIMQARVKAGWIKEEDLVTPPQELPAEPALAQS